AGILFASRRRGLPVSPLLGTRLSGNGDAIMLAHRWAPTFAGRLPQETLTEPGPTITRMADLRDRADRRHLIQDAVAPEALAGLLARVAALGSGDRPDRDLDDSLVLLAMGYDASLGRLVERDGRIDVWWPGSGRDPVQLAERATMAAMAEVLGSRLMANPRL